MVVQASLRDRVIVKPVVALEYGLEVLTVAIEVSPALLWLVKAMRVPAAVVLPLSTHLDSGIYCVKY